MISRLIHHEKAPFFVKLDDKEVTHYLNRKKFEESEEGWYYSMSKRSVLIKYKAPKKDHEVLISFEQFDMIGM